MPKLLEPLLAGRKEEDEGNLKSRHLKTCRTRQSEPAEAQVLSHPNLIKSDFRWFQLSLSRFLTTLSKTQPHWVSGSTCAPITWQRPWLTVATLAPQFRFHGRTVERDMTNVSLKWVESEPTNVCRLWTCFNITCFNRYVGPTWIYIVQYSCWLRTPHLSILMFVLVKVGETMHPETIIWYWLESNHP